MTRQISHEISVYSSVANNILCVKRVEQLLRTDTAFLIDVDTILIGIDEVVHIVL